MVNFNALNDRELMAEIAKRPGMFTGRTSYTYMVHFLNGYALGQERAGAPGLKGFSAWLETRLGYSSPLGWPHMALLVAFPDRDLYPRDIPETEQDAAVAGLFSVLDQFLAEDDAQQATIG